MAELPMSTFMLLLDSQVTVFLFFSFFFALFCFSFSCLLLRFGFAIVAPRIIVIDHLLKTFNFFKKEVLGSEKKSV